MVLDIRLNTLHDKVDKFVIAEATKNHAGHPKKLNFKINNMSFKETNNISATSRKLGVSRTTIYKHLQ